jgi:uncharacterized Zn finger protein
MINRETKATPTVAVGASIDHKCPTTARRLTAHHVHTYEIDQHLVYATWRCKDCGELHRANIGTKST